MTAQLNVSEGKNMSKLPRGYSCGILGKRVAAFCPCPKNLSEAELKSGLSKKPMVSSSGMLHH